MDVWSLEKHLVEESFRKDGDGGCLRLGIPCLTSLDTAAVLALTLESQYNEDNVELVDIAHIAHGAAARKELSQMEKPEEIQIPGYVLQEHDND